MQECNNQNFIERNCLRALCRISFIVCFLQRVEMCCSKDFYILYFDSMQFYAVFRVYRWVADI